MDTKLLPNLSLSGPTIQLLPLSIEHKQPLLLSAGDGKLSKLWYTSVPEATTIEAYIRSALQARSDGAALPFVVKHQVDNKIIGTTRFCNIDTKNKRLEIGYTWYAKSYQRTGVNTECKYLLLQYAFETLGCVAVEFRTHWHNLPSRRAIERLGAKQDGVLRQHRVDNQGRFRDTVVFSILDSEWPTVKQSLEHKMNCYD